MTKWTRRELTNGAALCLELGAGLLENGAETSRVEESIRLAGVAFAMDVEAMVHPTGVTVGFGDGETITRVARIKDRSVDLNKVALLNELSREISGKPGEIKALRERVKAIRSAPNLYGIAEQAAATAIACACLTFVVGGGPGEMLLAALAGCSSGYILERFGNGFPSFLSLFGVGFLCSVFALVGTGLFGLATEAVVVGSLLYQMPGLAIVSAMRDLMAGELVAGNARLAEAVLVTLGMASGVLACLGVAVRLGFGAAL